MWPRIEDYALIGDQQTAALVGRDSSVDWLCLPRFDSAACFARLLGDEDNGRWRIAPKGVEGPCARRAYRPDTLVLDSEWDTPEGSVRVTDLMPQRDRAPDLVRIVEGLSGRVTLRSTLRLRFDHGAVVPWMRRSDGHRVAVAGPDSAWLRSEPPVRTWGFLPPDDPRVAGTIEAVRAELGDGGLVRRYGTDTAAVDGLPGGEGTFLVCSFWLADALHMTGRTKEAEELFEHLVGLANDVGLLAEEYLVDDGSGAGRRLGHFPQAFSHIGLVNTALALYGDERAG